MLWFARGERRYHFLAGRGRPVGRERQNCPAEDETIPQREAQIHASADVLTLAKAGRRLAERWRSVLASYERFWIVTDADEKGERAAAYWLSASLVQGVQHQSVLVDIDAHTEG